MTNGDTIRQMTDEELGERLTPVFCSYCAYENDHENCRGKTNCQKGWRLWLVGGGDADITLSDNDSRAALLEVFYQQCRELPARGSKKLAYRNTTVAVYKDEEYADLFDVIFLRDGIGSEDTDFGGVHSDELEELVEGVLFPDTAAAEKKIYTVRIEQTLEGFADIEAGGEEEAEAIARDRYITQGLELPQMDDCDRLHIHIPK